MPRRIPFLALSFLVLIPAFHAAGQAPNSAWVYPSATGELLYQLDERGQRIADHSQCGYRGGTEPLPNVNALIPQNRWVYVNPDDNTDDTARIQAAIDSVKLFTPDSNGWRGVVYLNAGEYQLATTLRMNSAGGVVLKGAGDDPLTGTRLRATGTARYDLISANGSGSRTTVPDTTRNLIQKLVPDGTRTFEVDSTSGLAVGHTVIVKRPSTTQWIADIDMDQLAPVIDDPNAGPWTAGSKDLFFDRVITRIDGNWITVDAPLPQTFESQYGGGQIWRYTWSGRMEQIGIEDIYAFSDYVSPTDEEHAWNFIYMSRAQHGWVRNITARYFALSAVWLGTDCKWITVADSLCIDPVSTVDGGRRYAFQTTDGELSLFVNNDSQNGRHDYSFGAVVPGPNAFVHGTADTALNDTGPHQRWAVGGLFDMLTINGNEINVRNRGNSGSGHGWAGAYMTVWNCKANGFRVRNPPTARNWLVGSIGTIGTNSGFSVGADPPGTYDSSGPSGTGKAVYPRSLYYGQLQQRMKSPGSEFREAWLGDVDQHTDDGAIDTVNCDPAWLAEVETIGPPPADARFDHLVGNRHTACTMDFPLDPGDTILAASLTVSLRGIGSAASDSIWLDSSASPQTYASLGWTPVSTTAPTVRTMEISPALLSDGRLNLAFGTNTAVDFAVLHLQVRKAQRSSSTITLSPEADAYVQGGTNANTNYGSAITLQTKEDTNANLDRETFLRWDLSGITGKIVHAKVRLAGTSAAQTGNENCATFVSDDTWDEAAITFSSKPAAGKLFAQWLPVTGQAVEFTVTPQVLDTLIGDGKLSLRILSTDNHGANGNVSYASRENTTAANRPQLILTIENPPTAAIKGATGSALNADTAWSNGFVPVNPDTATWNASSLAGAMTLGAAQSWAGLIVSNPAAPLTFNGAQTLTLGSAGIDMSSATGNLTLNHPVSLAENQAWNVGTGRTLAATGPVSGSRNLTKSGAGSLVFSGVASFTDTILDNGSLAFTADPSLTGSLTFGASVGSTNPVTLDLSAASAGFANLLVQTSPAGGNVITIGSGKTLTLTGSTLANALYIGSAGETAKLQVTGANGTLTVNDATRNIVVASTNSTTATTQTMDLSGLGTFNATIANLYIGRPTGSSGNATTGRSINDSLTLAADNTLTASGTNGIIVGASTSTGSSTSTPARLILGSANVLNADQFVIGHNRISGTMQFNTGLTNPAVTLRGAAGGSSRTDIYLGDQGVTRTGVSTSGGGSTNNLGKVDFTGGTVDAMIGSLFVGLGSGSNSTRAFGNGSFTIDGAASVVDINTLVIAQNVNANATATATVSTGTFTMKNGTLKVNNAVTLANDIDATATPGGTENLTATLAIAGGAATIGSPGNPVNLILGNHINAGNPGTNTASVSLAGGSLDVFGNIREGNPGDGTITSSLVLDGATLDMKGNSIGISGALIDTLTFASGTLQNVAGINDNGNLTKTTGGTLTIKGANTYAGTTAVGNGTLALVGSLAGPLTVTGGTFAPQGLPSAAGAFSLNAAGTFKTRINGTTAGTSYDQFTAGGGVTLGGPLDLIAGPGLGAGESFIILNKTSAGTISGTFAAKPEGSVFTEDGYSWIISYLGGDGNDVTLTLATPLQVWRFTYFGTVQNTGNAADGFDANADGESNLIEYATAQNPTTASLATLTPLRIDNAVEITYTRSRAAFDGGMIFTVEWSDTLAPDSWSDTGVTQSILTDNGVQQSVKAAVPAAPGIPTRFARLKVSQP